MIIHISKRYNRILVLHIQKFSLSQKLVGSLVVKKYMPYPLVELK